MIRISGEIRDEEYGGGWQAEIPLLGIGSRASSREVALGRVADTVARSMHNRYRRDGVQVWIHYGSGDYFELGVSDAATLTARILRRARYQANLTLREVAYRLGQRSVNAYARYEQGRVVPSISRLAELYAASLPSCHLVLSMSRDERLYSRPVWSRI